MAGFIHPWVDKEPPDTIVGMIDTTVVESDHILLLLVVANIW